MSEETMKALNRTFLLMRDDVSDEASDRVLLEALTDTKIVLVADGQNLESHAAQCAFVTSALLMARSGHSVYLVAPDIPLVSSQLPLTGTRLLSSLLEMGTKLLPGRQFTVGAPAHAVDLCVRFGDSQTLARAKRTLWANADAWSAFLEDGGRDVTRWRERNWPTGALGVAALAAGEAFKCAMRRLRPFARFPQFFDLLFAANDRVQVELAPAGTPQVLDLGRFDLISGGAISHALLYCLCRIPGVRGIGRVIEPDVIDISNANRYQLMSLAEQRQLKIDALLAHDWKGLTLEGLRLRYEEATLNEIGALAPRVLVGVDHIPTRWAVQRARPRWLGVGATTHWSAMASAHERQLPCAHCLHPRDDVNEAAIPTVAFVSFWSGLLLSVRFIRHVGGQCVLAPEQQSYLTAVRPESGWHSAIGHLPQCPTCSHVESKSRIARAI